mmetsp:Transcript_50844/g.145991  ORF Transcript_50844/g.145991 Transcript_50844/m.145991 type:complete len:200 (+) Transcript_50844:1800-2399(+)
MAPASKSSPAITKNPRNNVKSNIMNGPVSLLALSRKDAMLNESPFSSAFPFFLTLPLSLATGRGSFSLYASRKKPTTNKRINLPMTRCLIAAFCSSAKNFISSLYLSDFVIFFSFLGAAAVVVPLPLVPLVLWVASCSSYSPSASLSSTSSRALSTWAALPKVVLPAPAFIAASNLFEACLALARSSARRSASALSYSF